MKLENMFGNFAGDYHDAGAAIKVLQFSKDLQQCATMIVQASWHSRSAQAVLGHRR